MRPAAETRANSVVDDERIISPFLLWLIWLPWLFFLTQPIGENLALRSTAQQVINLGGLALFVALYLIATFQNATRLSRATPIPRAEPFWKAWGPIVALFALGVIMTLAAGQSALGSMIYVSAALCGRLTGRQIAFAVPGLALLVIVLGAIIGAPLSASAQVIFIVPAVGLFVYFLDQAIRTNQELRRARQEIARLAVTEERLRFARDLHDLLGHTLSLITLKSELARRLVSVAPEQAAVEIGDIETAARQALVEVREAVSGYRQPTLHSELSGARELLDAAGIAYTQQGEPPLLAPPSEAALSWAVREGVTNVIRHSRATSCAITFAQQGGRVSVEVRDDGRARRDNAEAPGEGANGGAATRATGGSGLAGLKERVAALGGSCEAGAVAGGWRLAVSLPTDAIAAAQAEGTDAPEDVPSAPVDAHTEKRAEKGITAWFG